MQQEENENVCAIFSSLLQNGGWGVERGGREHSYVHWLHPHTYKTVMEFSFFEGITALLFFNEIHIRNLPEKNLDKKLCATVKAG